MTTATQTETRKCLCCEKSKPVSGYWYPVNDRRTGEQLAWQCEECNDRLGSLA